MGIEIKAMTYMDLDRIVEIEKLCFSTPWSKESFANELLNDLAYYHCAIENNNIVGFMGMWKVIDEAHITNVAVIPSYRNRGIASLLISQMIEVCICSEINSMILEVRQSNGGAIHLYEKFGFFEISRRKNYYQKPIEDAIVMWKKI